MVEKTSILSSVFIVVDVLERLYCHDDGVGLLLLGATDRPVCAAPAPGNVGKVPGRSPRQRRVPHVDQERALVHNLRAAGGGGQGGRRWWWWWHGVISGRLPAASGDGDAVCTRAWHSLKCFVVLEKCIPTLFSVILFPSSLSGLFEFLQTIQKNPVLKLFCNSFTWNGMSFSVCVAPLLRNSKIESTYTQTLSLDGDVEK